jgi:hypothetical protein
MTTRLLTVTYPPVYAGTLAARIWAAMQPPVGVPAKGGPDRLALVTRPDGANVTNTTAVPLGSAPRRHDEAAEAAAVSAARAAPLSNPAFEALARSLESGAWESGALALGAFAVAGVGGPGLAPVGSASWPPKTTVDRLRGLACAAADGGFWTRFGRGPGLCTASSLGVSGRCSGEDSPAPATAALSFESIGAGPAACRVGSSSALAGTPDPRSEE